MQEATEEGRAWQPGALWPVQPENSKLEKEEENESDVKLGRAQWGVGVRSQASPGSGKVGAPAGQLAAEALKRVRGGSTAS